MKLSEASLKSSRLGRAWAIVVMAVLASPTAATAIVGPNEPYETEAVSRCCSGETIESGATERENFVMRNSGTYTWGEPPAVSINLGTNMKEDRLSPFRAADWPTGERLVDGVTHPVPHGASYKFVFDVTAPQVSVPTVFTENYALLAETVSWLNQNTELGPNLELQFTVVPPQPPTIGVSVSPSSLVEGASFSVNANATDVASVNRVSIQFAGQHADSAPPRNPEGAADERTTWSPSATFSTSGVGIGPHTVTATVYSDAGLSATTTATVQVLEQKGPPPPPPSATSAVDPFRMIYAGSTLPRHGNELRLARVGILGTHKGETVFAVCRHCHGHSKLGPFAAKGGEVVFRPRNLVMSGRSTLQVYVTAPGKIGRFRTYSLRIASGTSNLRQAGCLAVGSTTHTACPG